MSQELGGGATWRLPSRTRRKLAQQAADLLAALAGGTTVAPDTGEMRREIEIEMRGESKLISLAREALTPAPAPACAAGTAGFVVQLPAESGAIAYIPGY